MLLHYFALFSAAACAIGHLILFALLAARGRGVGPGRLLLAGVAAEMIWGVLALLSLSGVGMPISVPALVDGARNLFWIGFVIAVLAAGRPAGESSRRNLGIAAACLSAAVLAAIVLLITVGPSKPVFVLQLLVAIAGLVAAEQLWRNLPANRRWALKFLFLAVTFKFGYDLLLYSDALMFGQADVEWWLTRGVVNALLVPLIAVAAARNPQWQLDVNVSRTVVFHSATLLITGIALTLIALGGYYLKYFGGSAGKLAATVLVFGALVVLVALVASGRLRAMMRVYLAKHFFSYRFDYRQEWLRLTQTLAGDLSGSTPPEVPSEVPPGEPMAQRALRAIATIVDSPAGALYLRNAEGMLLREAVLGRCDTPAEISTGEAVWPEIEKREWIVDAGGQGVPDGSGGTLPAPQWFGSHPSAWLLIPLLHEQALVGAVMLTQPLAGQKADWELRDLLKTAGRQVASYLMIHRTVETLVQAQQFESFNRMSAFVVHDLKNLVSQLSLLTRNAERHQGNPEFQADMIATVKNVVDRMQNLLLQLRAGPRSADPACAVTVGSAVRSAIQAKGPLHPLPQVQIEEDVAAAAVTAHPDRLERVIGHLVQNAVEATPPDGTIRVHACRQGSEAVIEVADSGAGMTEDFLRNRYFKPFATTKGHGTGLGAFESREYIHEIGGTVSVSSAPRVGTTVRIRLPLRDAA